ncbi:EAL domain-containing protein [Paraburkholderia sp. J8-2]|uniref:EAL domain-containing protein n=1 Tax=Paraburkholderia sp. J8-2 TaxID=2805440 RepID=UPI002AB6B30D|nr:EAL domain-containing protein [Paraburkholderia sp. J8-2]
MLSGLPVGIASTLTPPDPAFYGREIEPVLRPLGSAIEPVARMIVLRLHDALAVPRTRSLLGCLTDLERDKLVRRHTRYLRTLASARLTPTRHLEMALRLGRLHAEIGIPREELLVALSATLKLLREALPGTDYGHAHYILSQRLVSDIAQQAVMYQVLQDSRASVLSELEQVVRGVTSNTDLLSQCARVIGELPEVAACSFLAPDTTAAFQWGCMAGDEQILSEISAVGVPDLAPNVSHPSCIPWQAWSTGQSIHCLNVRSDPRMWLWQTACCSTAARSLVCVPISARDRTPRALLALFSRSPGGFDSPDQRALVRRLQDIIGAAYSRLDGLRDSVDATRCAQRNRWAELIRADRALQIYYQPIIDLKTGHIIKAEALARLRDGDKVIAPAEFFPGLSAGDFYEIYRRGLHLALTQGSQWIGAGLKFRIALNLPSSALGDPRYLHATTSALSMTRFPPEMLELELLETDALPGGIDVRRALEQFKGLGIALAEDDLGSGHSSLNRLSQLPFDTIKIDRAIVRLAGADVSRALRFIYQLTRLGQSLGKNVIVEGIEDVEMLNAVRILGSDAAQGYVIAAPMPAENLAGWVKTYTPFRMPATDSPVGMPSRVASLLLWEERLHLLLDREAEQTRRVTDIPTPFPFDGDADTHEALIAAARRHGMRSAQYAAARANLLLGLCCPEASAHRRQLSA